MLDGVQSTPLYFSCWNTCARVSFFLVTPFFTDRAYSRKYGRACGLTKKGQKRSVKGHNYQFFPLNFPNLGHLECYNSPKWLWFWWFLQKISYFISNKRSPDRTPPNECFYLYAVFCVITINLSRNKLQLFKCYLRQKMAYPKSGTRDLRLLVGPETRDPGPILWVRPRTWDPRP